MEHTKRLKPTIALILMLFIIVISIFWYGSIDTFSVYQIKDKVALTYEQAQDSIGVNTVIPERTYYYEASRIIQKTKTKIPLIYKKRILKEEFNFFSEPVEIH